MIMVSTTIIMIVFNFIAFVLFRRQKRGLLYKKEKSIETPKVDPIPLVPVINTAYAPDPIDCDDEIVGN